MNVVIAWFARNGVAANLLLGLIVVVGVTGLRALKKEVFPELSSDLVSVTVVYPGAAPEEVERAVCARIEERVLDLDVVEKVRSVAAEDVGVVTIELQTGADLRSALDDVKTRVDAIESFPAEAEKPITQEVNLRRQVLSVVLSGPTDDLTLRRLGDRLRDEIAALPGITQVELVAGPPYEISIEVSEAALRRHGLSFDEISRAIRRSSLDLGGGSVRTQKGEALLRVKGQVYRGRDFEQLTILTRDDGTRLELGEVAEVVDSLEQSDQTARFDGQPAIMAHVYRVGDQDAAEIAERVRAYVGEASSSLPEGLTLTIWQDESRLLAGRLDTMLRSGWAGLLLVLLMLSLFLHPSLAVWVALGIPVSILGALGWMSWADQSINIVSLFAFVLVLGFLVDDAIVVGESIYGHLQRGLAGPEAAISGTQEVAIPVTFSILTSIAAFMPLTLIPGSLGEIARSIPLIVIAALVVSLVESLLVLPGHLSHLRAEPRRPSIESRATRSDRSMAGIHRSLSSLIDRVASRNYGKAIEWALDWRYTTVAIALSALLVTVGFVAGGHIEFGFAPTLEADNVVAFLTLPQGSSPEATSEALASLEASALRLRQELEDEGEPTAFRHILASTGSQPFRALQSLQRGLRSSITGSHLGEINIELSPSEDREVSAVELVQRWRELSEPIPEAVELRFESSVFPTAAAIDIQVAGPKLEDLRQATDRLKESLRRYPGVYDISDSFRPGKEEIELALTAEGELLGLTLADLARQVRQAFHGEEAQRIQRGRHEIRVMIRLPESERRSLASLEQMYIRTSAGDEVPFAIAGRLEHTRGLSTIERVDGQRTVRVTAGIDPAVANRSEILSEFERSELPRILEQFPRLSYSLEGEQAQQNETLASLERSYPVALFAIYSLLAASFRSYLGPIVVMSAIPFGLIGAVWGHVLLGYHLTLLSLFGFVGVTGIVVNDSLVLLDCINGARRRGVPLQEAIREAGVRRFRPIVLTSLTTFAGLTPLLLERSLQAQFLIPMAISIAFGVLFATFVILFVVPVCYRILEDLKAVFRGATAPGSPSEPADDSQAREAGELRARS